MSHTIGARYRTMQFHIKGFLLASPRRGFIYLDSFLKHIYARRSTRRCGFFQSSSWVRVMKALYDIVFWIKYALTTVIVIPQSLMSSYSLSWEWLLWYDYMKFLLMNVWESLPVILALEFFFISFVHFTLCKFKFVLWEICLSTCEFHHIHLPLLSFLFF